MKSETFSEVILLKNWAVENGMLILLLSPATRNSLAGVRKTQIRWCTGENRAITEPVHPSNRLFVSTRLVVQTDCTTLTEGLSSTIASSPLLLLRLALRRGHSGVHKARRVLECHIDIVSRFGARLKEDEVFLPRKSRTLIKRDLAVALEVRLVPDEREDDVLARLRLRFGEPG